MKTRRKSETAGRRVREDAGPAFSPAAEQSAAAPAITPAELIRTRLDAGFAAVQTGNMRSRMGFADASSSTRAFVETTVATVRATLAAAQLSESQLAVVNKKIQALKDAAERIPTD